MTLRTRITLWHGSVLLIALALMAGVFHYELKEDRQALRSGQPVASPWEETGEFVLYFGLPTALLLLAGSTWFIRRSLTPVVRLTEAVERIHLHHLQERLAPAGTGDEVDRLTEVFNAMTTRLHGSVERVHEFTLHASHELKTPLTILQGELETALRDETCDGVRRELLAGLLDEIHRLTKIVDSLALLSKADAGQAQLNMESVPFHELVRDSFTDTQVLAESAKIKVRLTQCAPGWVKGDRHRLRQLLLNLTDNAIKYNQPEGEVEMALASDGQFLELRVTNTGPGIPPEKLPRVFDRFFRGDPAHGSAVEGCGLGLTIVQWIVAAHQGQIDIASTPNKLTTVRFRLPALSESKA